MDMPHHQPTASIYNADSRTNRRAPRPLLSRSTIATRVGLVAAVTLALAALTTQAGLGQTRGGSASTVPASHPSSRLEPATEKIRAYPRVMLGVDGDLEYLGTF